MFRPSKSFNSAPKGYPSRPQGQRNFERRDKAPEEPKLTQEQSRQVKAFQIDLWNRAMSLVVLPAGFPLCYCCGNSWVCSKDAWTAYYKTLYTHAKNQVLREPGEDGDIPFSWGLRPINPAWLTPYDSQQAADFTTAWLFANIAPYPRAVKVFFKALREAQVAQPVLDDLTAAFAQVNAADGNPAVLKTDTVAAVMGACWYAKISPTQLMNAYAENAADYGLNNLALYQMTPEQAAAKKAVLAEKARILSQQFKDDVDDEPPAAQPQGSQQNSAGTFDVA